MIRYTFLALVYTVLILIQAGITAAAIEPGTYYIVRVGGEKTITASTNGSPVKMVEDLESNNGKWVVTKNNNDGSYTFKNVGTGLFMSFNEDWATENTLIRASKTRRSFRAEPLPHNEEMFRIYPLRKIDLIFTVEEIKNFTISFQKESTSNNNWFFLPVN
ncbi:hypothetical protein FBU30_004943 [Linnemannia zychae]|nr:hypothetical protein FBU30_004943 [Linnemannia zychae]